MSSGDDSVLGNEGVDYVIAGLGSDRVHVAELQ